MRRGPFPSSCLRGVVVAKRGALHHRFAFHPADDVTAERLDRIRGVFRSCALAVDDLVPEGREQSLALTRLEEAMFWSVAGAARECR